MHIFRYIINIQTVWSILVIRDLNPGMADSKSAAFSAWLITIILVGFISNYLINPIYLITDVLLLKLRSRIPSGNKLFHIHDRNVYCYYLNQRYNGDILRVPCLQLVTNQRSLVIRLTRFGILSMDDLSCML